MINHNCKKIEIGSELIQAIVIIQFSFHEVSFQITYDDNAWLPDTNLCSCHVSRVGE